MVNHIIIRECNSEVAGRVPVRTWSALRDPAAIWPGEMCRGHRPVDDVLTQYLKCPLGGAVAP